MSPVGQPGRAEPIRDQRRSWPHTERLAYRVGDTVRMRLINAGAARPPNASARLLLQRRQPRRRSSRTRSIPPAVSPHLGRHRTPGAWPDVLADVEADAARQLAVSLPRQRPSRLRRRARRHAAAPPRTHRHVENHALEMMAGPVMGITVTGESLEPRRQPPRKRRQICAWSRASMTGGTDGGSCFGYTLDDGSGRAAAAALPAGTDDCCSSVANPSASRSSTSCPNQPPCTGTASSWRATTTESPDYAGEGNRIAPRHRAGRLVRSALHAAALGHVHLPHAPRRHAAAAGRAFGGAARGGRSGDVRSDARSS